MKERSFIVFWHADIQLPLFRFLYLAQPGSGFTIGSLSFLWLSVSRQSELMVLCCKMYQATNGGDGGNKRPTIERGEEGRFFLKEARPSITGFPLHVLRGGGGKGAKILI
jgi:hypothetical protein